MSDPNDTAQGDIAALQIDSLIQRLIGAGLDPTDVLAGAFGSLTGALVHAWGHAEAARLCEHARVCILARLPQPPAPDLASLSPQGRA